MSMGSFSNQDHLTPSAEINMTPLVDVMLVLLIIFIITAPLMTHSVKVDLPRASSSPTPEKPMTLQVSITAGNQVFVGPENVAPDSLEERFHAAVAQDPQVEMHLKADRDTRYETVAETMSAARRAGLAKIGFVTMPGAASEH